MKYDELRQFAVEISASINDEYVSDTISFEQVNTLYLLLPKQYQQADTIERIIRRGYQLGINITQIISLAKSIF